MGSESSLWNTLRNNMGSQWEATRVENPAAPGTPDVYYTLYSERLPGSKWTEYGSLMGWLELKHAHEWPKRESTILKVEHFTPQQKGFIRRHGRVGANVKLLIQVKRDYMLFDWENALRVGEMTQQEMLESCMKYWSPRIDFFQFPLFLLPGGKHDA